MREMDSEKERVMDVGPIPDIVNDMEKLLEHLKEEVVKAMGIPADLANPSNALNATEALYGFAGWLTSRPEPTIMSAEHDAGVVADRVKDFCEANNLGECRQGWEKNLAYPSFVSADEPTEKQEPVGERCGSCARFDGLDFCAEKNEKRTANSPACAEFDRA